VTDPKSGALVGLIARKDLLRLRSAAGSLERDRQAYFRPAAASGVNDR
jgi:hypothetical protein